MMPGAALLLSSLAVSCGDGGNTAGTGDAAGTADQEGVADSGKNDGRSGSDAAHADDRDNAGEMGGASESGGGGDGAEGGGPLSPLPVDLGSSGSYVILAKAAISTVPTSSVTGNMGISPAAATYITGFSLTMDSTNEFSTSPQVTGDVYASDYAVPTPSNLTTAIGDMQTAFTDAAGRPAGVTELGAGNIGGMTLTAGVYKWSTALLIPTDVVLTGSATDVWIFQIAKKLTVSNGTSVDLAGGALAKNVFWQVGDSVTLGTTSHFEGVILGQTKIALETGASITGRLLAQTAVNIESSTVVQPAP
jgi:hypothetical protein